MTRRKPPTGRKRRAARGVGDRPERRQDPRLVAARALAQDGVPFSEERWVLGVSPARMADGRLLMWYPPQPVAFNLIESKRYRDRGVKRRRAIMAKLHKRPNGDSYGPGNARAAIDCLSDLHTAVLFAFTGIESLANHAIDMLDDETSLTIRRGREVPKPKLVRALGIDDKLKKVMPLFDEGKSIAGTPTWTRYRGLKFLRDELLHVKQRGYSSDPDEPSAYDRLMLGDGDTCVEDAIAVVEGAWPGFLPDHVRNALAINPTVNS